MNLKMPRRYKQEELEKILIEFQSETDFYKLSRKIRRSPYGLARKMQNLSEQNPEIWNPEKVRSYTRKEIKKHRGNVKEQKIRYRLRNRSEKAKWLAEVSGKINWKEFRNYLTNCLAEYKFNKQHFSAEMKIHPSLLSHYLSERTPSYDFFRKVSEFIDIPYNKFEKKFIKV